MGWGGMGGRDADMVLSPGSVGAVASALWWRRANYFRACVRIQKLVGSGPNNYGSE